MAKATDAGILPALKWDGWCWRGRCLLPWYPSTRGVSLIVRTNCSDTEERTKPSEAPGPTSEQMASYRLLLDPASPTSAAVLAALQTNVPELSGGEWDATPAVLEFADLIVFAAAAEGAAYTGFVFNGMDYEHGIGVVAHRNRLVHIGFAETANEAAAQKDLRRLKRAKRGSE